MTTALDHELDVAVGEEATVGDGRELFVFLRPTRGILYEIPNTWMAPNAARSWRSPTEARFHVFGAARFLADMYPYEVQEASSYRARGTHA